MSDSKENADHKQDANGEDKQESPRRPPIPEEFMNLVGASPPKFVTFDQLMSAADGFKNMTLAHEIAVNNDFQLPVEQIPENSLEKKVRDTIHRAFWDAFQEKLQQDPPDYSMVYSMLVDLKESLIGTLLPQHRPLRDQINQVLDLELIKQKIENEAFDFEYYGNYITETMAKLCAPVRDDNIKEIKQIQEVVPKFKSIMETLDLMRKDMANFTIKQVRPYIQQNSIDYERKKFAEYFETQRALGINALQYTEVWLKRNFDKLKTAAEEQQSSGASSAVNAVPTPANVMTDAYLEILEWPDPMNFPETLMMDQIRFMGIRDTLQSLALMTAVQLVTFSVVGSAIDGVEALKVQLKQHVEILLADVGTSGIKSALESIAEQGVKDVNDSLTARSFPTLSDEVKVTLKSHVMNLGSRDNKVRSLMLQRLMEFMREGMSGKNLHNLQVPKGCSAVLKELAQVLGNFLRLTSHNRSVFGSQYASIIENLIKPQDSLPVSSSETNGEEISH